MIMLKNLIKIYACLNFKQNLYNKLTRSIEHVPLVIKELCNFQVSYSIPEKFGYLSLDI